MKRILLIEDDRDLNKGLAYDLELYEYRVYPAYTLAEGMALLDEKGADLILLDGSLPDGDGFDFCRAVKGECGIPVIFLTARDMEQDELQGFDCGADDYITKPFRMPILHRRIEAALRKSGGGPRPGEKGSAEYDDGFLQIDFADMTARLGGKELPLTPTKQLLLEKIWDASGNYVDEHTVAVNINRLRKKLVCPEHDYIKTMYGMGYQWKEKAGWR